MSGNVELAPMPGDELDVEFVCPLKRVALGPHIIPTWGWNEPLPARDYFLAHEVELLLSNLRRWDRSWHRRY
jgi:hypothetical protein